MIRSATLMCFLSLIIGCHSKNDLVLEVSEINLSTKHSGEPNLTVNHDGKVLLSWVEYENDSLDALKFSWLDLDGWSEPKTIAQGTDWFVNWADFPSLVNVDNSNMTAHWLQKSASGTYDYDVHLSQSKDGGTSWSPSFIPHRDGVNAEHGFVSMVPTPDAKTFAVWLDGRNTKNETDNAMTLRSAEIDSEGNLTEEVELDQRVCDCCQTGATWTDKGPIVVYRDRSDDEIRDISIVRKVDGKWTAPTSLHNDEWKIAGCPVNGPSIDSKDNYVAVAWFTIANGEPKVLISTSKDYGHTFSKPIRLDQGDAIGRVDVVVDNKISIVTWMENEDEDAAIKMRTVGFDGNISDVFRIGKNSGSRSSGFPRLARHDEGLFMAWTDALDSISMVRTFKISLENE